MQSGYGLHPLVSIRPSTLADTAILVAGRDVESRRFLGNGPPDASPAFCILVSGEVVGWVDRPWLLTCEVNVGYNVLQAHRPRGYASCAVRLLFDHLAANTEHTVATLLINPHNEGSLRVARGLGCHRQPDFDGNACLKVELTR